MIFFVGSSLPTPPLPQGLGDFGPQKYSDNHSSDIRKILYSLYAISKFPWATLDPIFVKTISLKRKAEKLLGDGTEAIAIDDLQLLKQEAELVRTDYQKCVINLSEEWKSDLIGIIPSSYDSTRYVYPLERFRDPGFEELRMFLERMRSFSTFFSASFFVANLEIRKT